MVMKNQYADCVGKLFEAEVLPDVESYRKSADRKAEAYFADEYPAQDGKAPRAPAVNRGLPLAPAADELATLCGLPFTETNVAMPAACAPKQQA